MRHAILVAAISIGVAGCAGPGRLAPECGPTDQVDITVHVGRPTTFSWTPSCPMASIQVDGPGPDQIMWQFRTRDSNNTLASPIQYARRPSHTIEPIPAAPLVPGDSYTVSMGRFYYMPNHGARERWNILLGQVHFADIAEAAPPAQSRAETPEEAAMRYAHALRDNNWTEVASLMHPVALAKLHNTLRPLLECQSPALDPIRQRFLDVSSRDEAAQLSDTEVTARFLRSVMDQAGGVAAAFRTATVEPIGHVMEGPDTAHVVVRLSFTVDSIPMNAIDVFSMARYHSTWRGLLKENIPAMRIMFRRLCAMAH